MLSRNFRLQKVGNLSWLQNHYNFKKIAFAIDELIILNVNRDERNLEIFSEEITKIIDDVFVPISVGGGVISMEYAEKLFHSGADKLVVNTALVDKPRLVKNIVKQYGSQSLIASIDFSFDQKGFHIFIKNGTQEIDFSFEEYINYIQDLGVGEVYLNSIQMDGTGQGYMIKEIESYLPKFTIPVIIAGGAGNSNHLIEAALHPFVDAVATANLFNFIGEALPNSREEMLNHDIHLAKFLEMNAVNLKLINNVN